MKRYITIIVICFFSISILTILIAFEIYKKSHYEPRDFDLFITDVFYRNERVSPWDEVDESNKRPIEWKIDVKEFEKLDEVYLGFKDKSNEKLYYMSWGQPNSRMREDLIIYRNNKVDSIPFGGFGCGTGIYLEPTKSNKMIGGKIFNPLMFHPYSGYRLPVGNKNFPELFKEIYGDSVAIRFKQATFGLPWNHYPPQMIKSNYIVINTEKVIENWEKGNFIPFPSDQEEHELSFYDMPKIEE